MPLSIAALCTKYHYPEWRYAECHDLLIVMPNVFMLSAVMLSVVMLSVMAPIKAHHFVVIFCIISVDAKINSNSQTFNESNKCYI
jgi:hypothetical protein